MELTRFEALGFTSNETKVYLQLAERGPSAATLIAKACRLPRSTVYSVLDGFEAKNLLRREKIKGSTIFRLREPEALIDWLNEESRLNQERQRVAQALVSDVKQLFRSVPSRVPRLEFVEGKSKVSRFLDENLLPWANSIMETDRSTWGYQDHTFVQLFNPWIKKAWKTFHQERGIQGRILSNRSDTERKLAGNIVHREVRYLSPEFNFESSTWIMGEYVIVLMTRKEPVYAFQIRDRLLANNLRLVFRHLYEQAKSS